MPKLSKKFMKAFRDADLAQDWMNFLLDHAEYTIETYERQKSIASTLGMTLEQFREMANKEALKLIYELDHKEMEKHGKEMDSRCNKAPRRIKKDSRRSKRKNYSSRKAKKS